MRIRTWFGFTSFEADVYYSRSMDDGVTWSPFLDLTSDAAAVGAARATRRRRPRSHGARHLVRQRLSDQAGPRIEIFYGRPGG
ncbi:MAG: hypothetical protein HY906_11295 [Deltaproteobacteria bacterium]|nr:hypothetical protein [Deltaproteobacteria bacterium]